MIRRSGRVDWTRVLVFGLILIGVAYAVVDRTLYAPQARTRRSLAAQGADAFYSLFMAQADSGRRAALRARGIQEGGVYVADPVLAANRVLQDAARRTGVHINSVAPTERALASTAATSATTLDVDLRATYPSLVRFVAILEGSPLLLKVTDIQLDAGQESASRLVGKMSLTVITPLEKEQG